MSPDLSAAVRERLRAAGELARLFSSVGCSCEIEPSVAGVLVYASTRVDAWRVARSIMRAVSEKDPRARVVGPHRDDDAGESESWWAEVAFDWEKI